MKTLKIALGLDDGTIVISDAIQHEGVLWLVTHWSEPRETGERQPLRIIRLETAAPQEAPAGYPFDLMVAPSPIPKAVLDGTAPPEQERGFDVRVSPAGDQDTIH